MGDYKANNTSVLEDRCYSLLKAIGLDVEKNNLENITGTDFKCGSQFIDFQYSCNFAKYGDLRIDAISAYKIKNGNSNKWFTNISKVNVSNYKNSEFKKLMENWIDINKWGKVLNSKISDHPKSLVYFIFNDAEHDIDIKAAVPDLIYFVKTDDLRKYIVENWKYLIGQRRFMTNDKSQIGDNHGSAFFAVNLNDLLNMKIGYVIDGGQILLHTIK